MKQPLAISGVTVQVRADDFESGRAWYAQLLGREPDFVPHAGFCEWELVPNSNCWLQVAEGTPTPDSGPLRLCVADVEAVLARLQDDLGIERPEVQQTPDRLVRYCTFGDPFGNRIGLFQENAQDVQGE